jgi:hypothetical protein
MRITSSIVAATGVLATSLTFAGALPAEAGKACNRLGSAAGPWLPWGSIEASVRALSSG